MMTNASPRDLLWVDGRAGLVVGVAMLCLWPWLSPLYGLPVRLLLVMGVANLAYGTCSGLLGRRRHRPAGLIRLLVAANGAWSLVCVALAVRFAGTASILGLASLLGEALFVGGLAVLEWRARARLATAQDRPA